MPYKSEFVSVTSPEQAPKEPHFAIFEGGAIHVPGDERSRTNPGHGYPGGTEHIIRYYAFTDEAAWKKRVEELAQETPRRPFLAAKIIPASIEVKTTVTVH